MVGGVENLADTRSEDCFDTQVPKERAVRVGSPTEYHYHKELKYSYRRSCVLGFTGFLERVLEEVNGRKPYPQTLIFAKRMLKSWVLAFFLMLLSPIVKVVIPPVIRNYICSIFGYYFCKPQFTIIIEEKCGLDSNRIYEAATIYLRAKISDSNKCLKVSKTNRLTDEGIIDCFENIKLKWKFSEKGENRHEHQKFIELSFDKKFENVVMESYLPYVITRSKTIKEKEKELRLYSRTCHGEWSSVILEHPATFEKLAMDPEVKQMIRDDLSRFVRRKEWYKKVGKAWKRGYLLYGPPGTGKSSLIAAMANYLKFNIYDLNLSNKYLDSDLRTILLSTTNRSILLIEDIDCYAELEDREEEDNSKNSSSKFTLSSLLNIIDGLWLSCREEQIIVFTTNDKDKLDPALLRPGHMDVHVHMSYCTMDGFKLLASNYLNIEGDLPHYMQIEGLLKNVEVTPAEIVEELLKSDDDTDFVLRGVVQFLEQKKREKAMAAEFAWLKEFLGPDIDVDTEGIVKFVKQKKLENAKVAKAEQLLNSGDTDVDFEGLDKFFKQKKLKEAKGAELKKRLKSADRDFDAEGLVQFIKQKIFENAKAAKAEQLLNSGDTDVVDVDVEGLVKIFKKKIFEDAKAVEAKCINPNES